MTLSLAWVGPWNEQSAIAAAGSYVVAALLDAGHQVEVVRTETGEAALLPPRPTPAPVHPPGALATAEIALAYDGAIVNLGNHYGFHGRVFEILAAVPAIAIAHDAWMEDFSSGWRAAGGAGRPKNLAIGGDDDTSPALTLLVALSCGAVVHAQHYLGRVSTACPGPVRLLPLPISFPSLPPPRAIGDSLTVATIGHANPNKRIREILKALAASRRLRQRVRYWVIGPVEPAERARLTQFANELGITEPRFTGYVSDKMLRELLADVDVITCLRNPILEGGSASLVLAMQSGRPTLVSDDGVYAEVPEEFVLKCQPGTEALDVIRHLTWILDCPGEARRMGEAAADYARRHHDPTAYATELVSLLEMAIRAAPIIMAARAMGRELADLGCQTDDQALERMGSVLDTLFLGRHQR